jgi:hypothetical protein
MASAVERRAEVDHAEAREVQGTRRDWERLWTGSDLTAPGSLEPNQESWRGREWTWQRAALRVAGGAAMSCEGFLLRLI